MISAKLPHVFYGGDYNAEQWPEEVWREDARLMQQAGVNLVTVGVFSWALLEPRPGVYDFGWLDRVLDLLAEHGIFVDLATATASPPPWLAAQHPESLPVTREGVRLAPGARQHYCPSSPVYREAAARLVRQLATRYADHPALALWHINNEYGCHVAECYCDVSAVAFRRWLQQRYTSLDALNAAWGTAFWSQHYSDWDEIQPPRAAPTFANPTQQLDFRRFSSDELLACFEAERAIVRETTPDVPITTNFMGFFKPVNYWQWAAREDVVANDSYPDPADPLAPMRTAMTCDLMRSLGGGKPWMLMEQTTSQVNWRSVNALKQPGQMRLWSLQALGRGADGIQFFQWRAAQAGAEKFHGAMVPHVGTHRSRIWDEVTALGAELKTLDAVLGAHTPAMVAMVVDWESWWALETDSKPSARITQMERLEAFYRPLYEANIAVQFIPPEADLSAYRVVIVPNLYLTRDGLEDHYGQFVAAGGTLVMSFFSGIVDQDDHIRLGGYPAQFRKLLGIRIEEFAPYTSEQSNWLLLDDGARVRCDLWSDVLDLEGAEALATYTDAFYAGRAAITRSHYGQGTAYYIGTRPDGDYLAGFLRRICRDADVQPPLVAEGVEVVQRMTAGGARYLFLLNQHPAPATVRLPAGTVSATDGHALGKQLSLEPYGAAIVRVK